MIKFVQNNYNVNVQELPDLIKHFITVFSNLLVEVRKNDHSGGETTGADGSDPTDPLPETVSTNHTPQSSIRELVDISDMVPENPSSLPVTSIADRYICSMLKCFAGYPLYEPEPFHDRSTEYLRHGVSIGDVGYFRGDGAFDFLFNICLSQNSVINPMLPVGFSLETSECSATRPMRPLPHETHLFQSPITRTSSGEYTCQGPEGAVLELPEGAIQEEAVNVLPFENLAARYGVEWYKYTMNRGRAIPNGSLYLITSVTKCAQWGIAVFDRHCASGQGLTFDGGSSFPFSFWNSTSKYRWKGPNTSNTKVANSNQGKALNQCVLLRGYKIMIRQDTFNNLRKEQRRGSHTQSILPSSLQAGNSSPTKVTRQKASRIRGGGGTDPVSRRLTGGSLFIQTTKSAVTESDEVVLQGNFNSSLIHPSDLINAALLSQNPSAKVALIHDDVWCNSLRNNFPKVNYATLIKIARSYTCMVDEYGCVSLEKASDSTNVESSRTVREPTLQVPIQGAKNPDISSTAHASIDNSVGDEGTTDISVPSQGPSTTRELPTPRNIRQRRREKDGKMNASDRQESHTPYQGRTHPRHMSKMATVFRRVRSFTISSRPSVNVGAANQQDNLSKREEELAAEERKLKGKVEEIRKKEEEMRKWEEGAKLTEDEAKLKTASREREILRKEAEAKQIESEAIRKEITAEEEARRIKEEARVWTEEMRQKADEIKKREEHLKKREEELERRQHQFEQYLLLVPFLLISLIILTFLSAYGDTHSILSGVIGRLPAGVMPVQEVSTSSLHLCLDSPRPPPSPTPVRPDRPPLISLQSPSLPSPTPPIRPDLPPTSSLRLQSPSLPPSPLVIRPTHNSSLSPSPSSQRKDIHIYT